MTASYGLSLRINITRYVIITRTSYIVSERVRMYTSLSSSNMDVSLNKLLERLEFLEDIWPQVGKALEVPEDALQDLQSGPQANIHKKNLKKVIKHWKEANLDEMVWAKLIEKLFDDQEIFQRHKHDLLELAKTYKADVDVSADQPHIDGIINNTQTI